MIQYAKMKPRVKKPFYSVVIPVYNEEKNVTNLHQEVVSVMKGLKKKFEIIFVNDGSTDRTLDRLKILSPIKIINFRANFGQSSSLDAGIKSARGEIIITMDGDGQNDPKDIPNLLKKLGCGFDVVCGWRYKRKDPFLKKFISLGARELKKIFVQDEIHDSVCALRVYRRECFEDLDLYGELHRMIPGLLKWRGFRVTEIKVNHRFRRYGKSKYDWKRIIRGFLDMIGVWFWRNYESRPLHLFGTLGLMTTVISIIFGMYLAIMRMFFGYYLRDKIWPLVVTTAFIFGIQLLVFGLLADLILKNRPKKDFYKIKEIIDNKS